MIVMLIDSPVIFITNFDLQDSDLVEGMELIGFRDAIVVRVDPDGEHLPDGVVTIDSFILIAAEHGCVEFSQGLVAIRGERAVKK